jgi:TetR/AcrR family transcriptional regulator
LSWLLDRDLAARRRVLKRRQHVVEMVLSYLTQNSPAEADGADTE